MEPPKVHYGIYPRSGYSLVIHYSVDVSDDTLISCSLDGLDELFFRAPIGPPSSFLVELAEIPYIIAVGSMSASSCQSSAESPTCRILFHLFAGQ